MKITIFGNPGTGTSTVGKLLATKLGYEFKSSGNMFRDMAKELGMTLYELDTLAQQDPQYDLKLDRLVVAYATTHDNFIFESRLAWHFIPDSIKIALTCEEGEATRRVAARDHISLEEAKHNNDLRVATYLKRYPVYYPDLTYPPSENNFDLSIDTTTITPEAIVEKILEVLKEKA